MNVYDFDETLYPRESCVDFALFYIKKDPSLMRFIPDIIKTYALYKKQKLSFDEFMEHYSEFFEQYATRNNLDFEALTEEFWSEKRIKQIRSFYQVTRKEDDLVISATPDFLVRKACEKIGIKNVVATEFDVKTGKFGKACFREGKIEFLRNACPEGAIDDFYTDSMNDKFLMPFAKRVFIVKGNKVKRIK